MPTHLTESPLFSRDGVSQAERQLAALDPDYVAIDERSLPDLLAFAREYAGELRFWGTNGDELQDLGDWRGFFGDEINLADLVAFMQQPEQFAAAQVQAYTRPHFALLLTFLHLFRHAQAQLNTLTRRHLDFTYRQLLRLTPQPGRPDQVHVLVDLAPDVAQFLLPAGTLLNAGVDSAGQERVYHTAQDLVANQAQIAQLRSVYVEKEVVGLREAREQHRDSAWAALLAMLKLALGQPQPGDALPAYPRFGGKTEPVTVELLKQLRALVSFVQTGLGLPDFATYRSLLQLKARRPAADQEWDEIATLIEKAGQRRTANFRLDPANRRNFMANLLAALGGRLPSFDGLTEVDNLDDLNRQSFRDRPEVQEFIRTKLYFDKVEDFQHVWRLKERLENEWQILNQLLTAARHRKDPKLPALEPPLTLAVQIPEEMAAFTANLSTALGADLFTALPGITTLDEYETALQQVERFFYLTVEQFATLVTVADQREPTTTEWAQVETILATAHGQKVYADRRLHLQQLRESGPDGFDKLIAFAAGAETTASTLAPFERLLEFVANPQESKLLTAVRDRVRATPPGSVSADEWMQIYALVELAQRQRERLAEPVPRREIWRNLYPLADATSAQVVLGAGAESQTPHWRTFGQTPDHEANASPPPATLGWAISSPLLMLSQGQRTVTLTLGFQADQFDRAALAAVLPLAPARAGGATAPFKPDANPPSPAGDRPAASPGNPWQIEISTAQGWIEPDQVELRLGRYEFASRDSITTLPALQLTLTFAANVDPLAPLPADQAPLTTDWPVLRLLLRPLRQPSGEYFTHYLPFKALILLRMHLQINVVGLIPAQLQNDDGDLAVNKPFEPFGTQPVAGARLLVSHPELVAKKLASLHFRWQWLGVPAAIKEHYKNYPEGKAINFTTRVSLIDQRLDLTLASSAPLFADPSTASAGITIDKVAQALAAADPGYSYRAHPVADGATDLLAEARYLQWELNAPDFQHTAYPQVVTEKSLQLAADIANKKADSPAIKPADYQVNPPYTPKIKQLTVDYSAAIELTSTDRLAADQIYHLHPFGYCPAPWTESSAPTYFLPQYDHAGELYIGLRDLQPPQTLTLLLQLAEGSANPDLPPAPVTWSYLSDNRWVSLLEGQLLADSTRGLLNSGLVTLNLPAAQPNTLLPGDLYWLRITIPRDSTSVCATVAIHTQAVTATLVDPGQIGAQWAALPPETISELVTAQPEVVGLRQPYSSYGGAAAEAESAFATRVSERLRHKQRALTVWDYEHLILARFPQIYKAKCLPALPDHPGQVTVIVIPDIRQQLPFNPFAPKAPANLLAEITDYLTVHTPALARVQVKNAHYVAVKVRFAVRFRDTGNEGYYKQRLNAELNRFLAPWAYAEGHDLVIGGRIYANQIINFLEERPYVDYITQVKLFRSEDDGRTFILAQPDPVEGYWVTTNRPDGVLVAARHHEIDILVEAGAQEERLVGINYMKIELDFVVG